MMLLNNRKRKPVEIGGHTYNIEKFPPFDGIEILGNLQRIFVEPMAEIARAKAKASKPSDAADAFNLPGLQAEDGAPADGEAMDAATVDATVAAVRKLSEKLDGKSLRAVATMLIREKHISIQFNGEGEAVPLTIHNLNTAMAKNGVGDLVELCVEVVAENYVGFFVNFGSLLGRVKFLVARQGNSPEED